MTKITVFKNSKKIIVERYVNFAEVVVITINDAKVLDGLRFFLRRFGSAFEFGKWKRSDVGTAIVFWCWQGSREGSARRRGFIYVA